MNNQKNLLKYIFVVILMFAVGIQIVYILLEELRMSLPQKLILTCIQLLSIAGYTYFHLIDKDDYQKNKGVRKIYYVVFIMYCINLLYVLFFDRDFGRHRLLISYGQYFQYNVNFIPFHTIHLFIKGYQMGIVCMETLLRNILGNWIIFMPMAYFLPTLIQCQRKLSVFFITMILIVLSVEVTQVFFRIGSGDIDDVLLNVSGAIVMYIILKYLLRIWED
jgi:Glycopeptide antibiotics resistance protein